MRDMFMMIISFLKRYKYTIAVFIYFQAIVYFQISTAWNRGHYLYYFINASSLLLILHLISKTKFIIRIVLSVIFSILVAFEAYYGFFFHCTVSLGIIASIMVTNLAEASDAMRGRMLPSVIIFGFTLFGIIKSVLELKNKSISVKWSLLLLSLYMFCCYPLYVYRKLNKNNGFSIDYYKGNPILANQMLITERFPLIYGQISSVIAFLTEKQLEKDYMLRDRTLPDDVFWENSERLPERIFFVLGESQYRKHLSIYGYDIKTIPFLDSLSQASPKMTVYDAISPANTTYDVTSMLFTFATPHNRTLFHDYKNLVELANDAGYQTVWLSNQVTFDAWGSVTTHFASSSQDIYFTGFEETSRIISDLYLIPKLREKYKKNVKQFFVIHLQGSHSNYSNKSDEIDAEIIKGNSIINQYDRSIHHTDRVLREIYRIVKADTSSVLFYTSDHGENVKMEAHGLLNGGFAQFDVPMFIINQSKIDVDAIVDKYFLHDKNRINVLSTMNILAELMGYSFSDEIISKVREESYYIYHVDGRTYKWHEME